MDLHAVPPDARWVDADRSGDGIACSDCGFSFPLAYGSVQAVLACPKCGAFVRMQSRALQSA